MSAVGVKIIRGLREANLVEALRRIAFLRPAGDVRALSRHDAISYLETVERIAIDALGEEQ